MRFSTVLKEKTESSKLKENNGNFLFQLLAFSFQLCLRV